MKNKNFNKIVLFVYPPHLKMYKGTGEELSPAHTGHIVKEFKHHYFVFDWDDKVNRTILKESVIEIQDREENEK